MELIRKQFTADELQKVRNKLYKMTGKNQQIIKEFADSDMDIALVYEPNWKNQTIGAGILNRSIKSMKLAGIRAMVIEGNTYLVKLNRISEI